MSARVRGRGCEARCKTTLGLSTRNIFNIFLFYLKFISSVQYVFRSVTEETMRVRLGVVGT